MPFLVKTSKPTPPDSGLTERTRYACASLDDAQAYIAGLLNALIDWREDPVGAKDAADWLWRELPNECWGHMLPDETVIDVEDVCYLDLARAADFYEHGSSGIMDTDRADIVAAYNEVQAEGGPSDGEGRS